MKKLILCISLIVVSQSYADGFRCGRALIKQGDSSNALIKKCGKPVRKFSSKERIKIDGQQTQTGVSNWVYTRSGKRDMIVSVRSGVVVKMAVD
jgi:hypothetical protein